jgi:hypothetical protein
MKSARQWRYWTLAFTLFCARAAAAQSNDNAALQQEIATLRQTVEQLAARVAAVERQLPPTSAVPATPGAAAAPASEPTAAPPSEAVLQDRWGQVGRGMTLAAIEALLGRPARTLNLENKTVWVYAYAGIGNGSIVFDVDGNVSDWQNPPFRQWW